MLLLMMKCLGSNKIKEFMNEGRIIIMFALFVMCCVVLEIWASKKSDYEICIENKRPNCELMERK